jgi:ATP-dependent RNA helicase DDX10/DBP4
MHLFNSFVLQLGEDDRVGPIIAPLSDDDGYISPDFDLLDRSLDGDDEEEDVDTAPPPSKLAKTSSGPRKHSHIRSAEKVIEDDEELVLQLLRKR